MCICKDHVIALEWLLLEQQVSFRNYSKTETESPVWCIICPFIFVIDSFSRFFYTLTVRERIYFISSLTYVTIYNSELEWGGKEILQLKLKAFLEVAAFSVLSSSETACSKQWAAFLQEPPELLQKVVFLFLMLTHDMRLRRWPASSVMNPIQVTNSFLRWNHPMTQHVCLYPQYFTSDVSDTVTFYINWELGFFLKCCISSPVWKSDGILLCYISLVQFRFDAVEQSYGSN